MKKILHIISHSHWDREWYMSFEQHRMRLVELLDSIIEKMESDENYRYFHLDGQTIVIDDYLEIRPEMKERLFRLINNGRIQVGPWYVLQDEFLTSGEANIRNMMEGLRYCRENGIKPVMSGYMPDAFGNISQMPQILNGFGIDNAIFGRGVDEVYADNLPSNESNYGKEVNWYGADGSKVIGVLFSDWYNNANELPVNEKKVKMVYRKLIDEISENSKTPNLLAMNGCDHQPLQRDLTDSIEVATRIFGDEVEIRHSNFKDFIKEIKPYSDKFADVYGELTGQNTMGKYPLVGTASTHIPIKQKNHHVQNLLTQQSEPTSVIADIFGDKYRDEMLRYAWKKLMQCHPHDSICCCSCDDVTRELSVRLDKAGQSADYVLDEAAEFIARNTDTGICKTKNSLVLLHTNPKKTEKIVKAEIFLNNFVDEKMITLCDSKGNIIPCMVDYNGRKFTYTLPKDSFRKPKHKHCYSISFPVSLSGIGCYVYGICTDKENTCKTDGVKLIKDGAENKFIKFTINTDGTLNIYHKSSKQKYNRLNAYEDTGDCGNSYDYKQTAGANRVGYDKSAEIKSISCNGFEASFRIVNTISIPKGLDGNKRRSLEIETHTIETVVSINAFSSRVDIKTEFVNKSENHRLRALFNSGINTDTALADGQFDVLKRDIQTGKNWVNPCNCQRMQSFFGLENEARGLLIAVRGLNEYEILRNGRNTMALTLLRSVGEMGDWGDFPTPEMQLLGRKIIAEYAIIPYAIEEKAEAFDSAYSFSGDFIKPVQTVKHKGIITPEKALIGIEGEFINYSVFKKSEYGEYYILRIYNVSEFSQNTNISVDTDLFKEALITNLAESEVTPINIIDGGIKLDVPPKKIITLRFKRIVK